MRNDDNGITDDGKIPGDAVRYGCVFCATGRESELVRLLTPRYPELRLISPVKQRIRRMGGEAVEERVTLLPGYVFFETGEADIPADLGRQVYVYKVLADPEGDWRLKGYDAHFAKMLFRENGEIGFSKAVFDEGERIHIVDGFLKDYEGSIVRVNRRARTVEVRIDIQGKIVSMWLGYELVEKNDG